MKKNGFTLIELLVTISIIGVLAALSLFAIDGARKSARDSRRKADLESIRSALEIYKSDCNYYPTLASPPSGQLVGDNSTTACSVSNKYLTAFPTDPQSSTRVYSYNRVSSTTYTLCAALEQAPVPARDTTNCSSCASTCNYKVTNP
jgi:general secretion pathway protein G